MAAEVGGRPVLARLFVAVWPPLAILDQVAALPRPARPGVRWTTRDQWHVTLRFFGNASPDAAVPALAAVSASSTEATLGPTTRRLGRSVVVVPVAGLDAVAAAVVAGTAHIGDPPEHRHFRGHLTLARLGPRAAAADLVGIAVSGRFPVSEVTLVASHLGHGPARYEVLERFPLGL